MSLQDASRLHMSALGIIGHEPLREDLPQLPDGVHLRWFFGLERGFPRGGYYLFRRWSTEPEPIEVVADAVHVLESYPPTESLSLDYDQHKCKLTCSEEHTFELGEPINRQDLDGIYSDDDVAISTIHVQQSVQFSLFEPYFANSIKVWVKSSSDTALWIFVYSKDRAFEAKYEYLPANEIRQFTFESDGLTRIDLVGYGVSPEFQLVALEYQFVDPRGGWQYLDPNPILLPVHHPAYDYEPTFYPQSKAEAVERIHTGSRDEWENEPSPFEKLHDSLLAIVGSQDPMDSKYLEWTRLAALDPVVAQVLGLYWLDEKNENDAPRSGRYYDYLVLANHQQLQDSLIFDMGLQDFVNSTNLSIENFPGVAHPEIFDVWISTRVRLENDTGVMQPEKPRAYVLPRPGALGQVGLHLENISHQKQVILPTQITTAILKPETPIMYQVWRHEFGQEEPTTSPDMSLFSPLDLAPIIPVKPTTAGQQTEKSGWPPCRIHAVDVEIDHEGWYGYCVNAIDIFGRHSDLSQPAGWWKWSPDSMVNEYAVEILDKIAPPPPNHIEASMIDPQDPFILKDQAYKNWLRELPDDKKEKICGLRVSWRWTDEQKRAASDAREFRIYLKSGRFDSTADTTIATVWEKRIHITDISQKVGRGCYPRPIADGSLLMGRVAERQGALVTGRVVELPDSTDLSTIDISKDYIHLEAAQGNKLFKIKSVREIRLKRTVEVDSPPQMRRHGGWSNTPPKSDWWIGPAYDQYEVFLPQPDAETIESVLPVPPLDEPILRAQIGITTADDKRHTLDDQVWSYPSRGGLGGRPGNESIVGGPREVLRVRREKPNAPVVPPYDDSENTYATPADYHGKSFYTFRWTPSDHLKTHIYRAIDESIFKADWKQRPRGTPPTNSLFPDDSEWDEDRKNHVIGELNELDTFNRPTDGKMPTDALAYYRNLSNDALRVLASYEDITRAFTQLTIKPLPIEGNEQDIQNRRGPDDPYEFELDDPEHPLWSSELAAYVDELDGRSTNRYFYRAAYVDKAHNKGSFSLSSPPIYLPNVVPPRKPVITKITLGNSEATIHWASNREADLLEYRIFRCSEQENSRDIRLMGVPIHTVAETQPQPELRPSTNSWTDTGLKARSEYWYCIQAVDTAHNCSLPSTVKKVIAVDRRAPMVQTMPVSSWCLLDDSTGQISPYPPGGVIPAGQVAAIQLQGQADLPGFTCAISRRVGKEKLWKVVAEIDTESDSIDFLDRNVKPNEQTSYRLRLMGRGGLASEFHKIEVDPVG